MLAGLLKLLSKPLFLALVVDECIESQLMLLCGTLLRLLQFSVKFVSSLRLHIQLLRKLLVLGLLFFELVLQRLDLPVRCLLQVPSVECRA